MTPHMAALQSIMFVAPQVAPQLGVIGVITITAPHATPPVGGHRSIPLPCSSPEENVIDRRGLRGLQAMAEASPSSNPEDFAEFARFRVENETASVSAENLEIDIEKQVQTQNGSEQSCPDPF